MSHKTAADVADNAVNQLSSAAQAITDAFKKVAPHVWEVMVRQQVLEGVTNLALFISIVVIFIISCVVVKKLHAKHDGFWTNDSPTLAFFALCMPAILAISISINASHVPEYITKVINPEYYAAFELLDSIK